MAALLVRAESPIKLKKPFQKRLILPESTQEDGGWSRKVDVDGPSDIADTSLTPTQLIYYVSIYYL